MPRLADIQTKDGDQLILSSLPDGSYELAVWHDPYEPLSDAVIRLTEQEILVIADLVSPMLNTSKGTK